jgi:plasmid stabilization system protein ParE
MPKSKATSIVWTARSLQHAISIKEYLEKNFSSKEIEVFFSLLESFEIAVCAYPELYPGSGIKKNIRRAVLSKVLSAFYRIHKGKIEVLAILDNRCDIGNWL